MFCGAGGCSVGYYRAGFEVVGVDINDQKNYPFEFHQEDALTFPLDGFDVIHASPPCQAYSKLRRLHPEREYPDLVAPVRERLINSGKPYVIENVEGAPLIKSDSITLCGSMFGLGTGEFSLRRHRLFESSIPLEVLKCDHSKISIGVFGHGSNQSRKNSKGEWRGRQASKAEGEEAMGIDWMIGKELTQSIPPAYTEFIGKQIIRQMKFWESLWAVQNTKSESKSSAFE